jgi:hypothetical protein
MDFFDTFITIWMLMILMIICFNAYTFRQLTKMREEE